MGVERITAKSDEGEESMEKKGAANKDSLRISKASTEVTLPKDTDAQAEQERSSTKGDLASEALAHKADTSVDRDDGNQGRPQRVAKRRAISALATPAGGALRRTTKRVRIAVGEDEVIGDSSLKPSTPNTLAQGHSGIRKHVLPTEDDAVTSGTGIQEDHGKGVKLRLVDSSIVTSPERSASATGITSGSGSATLAIRGGRSTRGVDRQTTGRGRGRTRASTVSASRRAEEARAQRLRERANARAYSDSESLSGLDSDSSFVTDSETERVIQKWRDRINFYSRGRNELPQYPSQPQHQQQGSGEQAGKENEKASGGHDSMTEEGGRKRKEKAGKGVIVKEEKDSADEGETEHGDTTDEEEGVKIEPGLGHGDKMVKIKIESDDEGGACGESGNGSRQGFMSIDIDAIVSKEEERSDVESEIGQSDTRAQPRLGEGLHRRRKPAQDVIRDGQRYRIIHFDSDPLDYQEEEDGEVGSITRYFATMEESSRVEGVKDEEGEEDAGSGSRDGQGILILLDAAAWLDHRGP